MVGGCLSYNGADVRNDVVVVVARWVRDNNKEIEITFQFSILKFSSSGFMGLVPSFEKSWMVVDVRDTSFYKSLMIIDFQYELNSNLVDKIFSVILLYKDI